MVYLIFFSSLFKIKNIQIIGNVSQNIKNSIDDARENNIFLFNAASLENNLKDKNPQFFDIQVSRGLPNTLRVKFTARQTKIIWQTQGKKYLVDENGLAFEELQDEISLIDLPKIIDNKNLSLKIPTMVASPNFVNFIREASIKLKEKGFIVKEFQINETTFQVDAIIDKGFKLIFDTTRPLVDQLDAFQKVYDEHQDEIKEYLDLRVAGWVYFK